LAATDETRDVKSDEGIVVGVQRLHTWIGPGEGPQLAVRAIKQMLGVTEQQPQTQEMK